MPRAYSDDLRCKLLEAYEAGRGSLQELAGQFGLGIQQEDSCPAVAHGAEATATAASAWSGEPIDGGGGAAVALRAPAAARPNLGGNATTTRRARRP